MKYELLGSLRVADCTRTSFISARKIELLLASLLIRADQIVSIDQLSNEIWGDAPPRRAMAALHVHISQLRKFLREVTGGSNPVVTRSPGYVMLLEPGDELDVVAFQRFVTLGRGAMRRGQHEMASEAFGTALGMFRGPVLGNLRGGPIVDDFVAWADEDRLECIEMKNDVDLTLGRHRELIASLYSLVAEYPLREAFHRQLMLALYRAERQGDALMVFHHARDILDRELGVEPARALRDLYQAILVADDELELRPAAA
ncbi:AfsR/SARP family transcriptional regulator [Streptomyces scopuliridis]|uniref:AfsR/SARP family transcriptional regulator n=1 Tax=Streptomyces scopuliridis TaxID=452529 RepID=UPI0034320111